MSKKYKRKHIPENSLKIIFKFDSEEKLNAFKNDKKYLKTYGELVTTVHQKGGISIDNFTPLKLNCDAIKNYNLTNK